MHEMAIIGNIVKVACREAELAGANRVVSVTIRVGEIRDFHDEWVQKYFDFLSEGTLAAGASINMVKTPLKYVCTSCGATYGYNLRERHLQDDAGRLLHPATTWENPHCPAHPGAEVRIVSGNEILIENLEVS